MITEEEMDNDFLEFVFQLYDIPSIRRNGVQNILQKVENLFEKPSFLNQVSQNDIKDYCPENISGALHIKFEEYKYPLKPYLTEHLRLKSYKQSGVFNEPEEFELGIDHEYKVNEHESEVKEVIIKAVFIPLKPNLKILFETPKMFNEIKKYVDELYNEKV